MSKPEYVMEHIDETMEFPEETLVGLRNFKLLHREKGTGTFEERTRSRFAGMQELINRMADSYGHTRPLFSMTNVFSGGSSGGSSYDGATNTINMDGKLSIITLLHEFAHYVRFQSTELDNTLDEELHARVYSLTLYRKIYPIAFEKKIVGPGSTAEGFTLVDPPVESGAG